MFIAQHVTLASERLVALPAAEVATVPVLAHRLSVLATIIVVGGGFGLFDLGDDNFAILRFLALGGLFDLSSFTLGCRVLNLYVHVGHGGRRLLPRMLVGRIAISPDAIATRIRMTKACSLFAFRNYSRIFSGRRRTRLGEGILEFKFGRVTEKAGARASFPNPRFHYAATR